MPQPVTSPGRTIAADRAAEALELRKAGKSYRAIGKALGISFQRAHMIVSTHIAEQKEHAAETADEIRQIELERLDELLEAYLPMAKAGDASAADRVLKIMDRRARYLGLDAPAKVEATIETHEQRRARLLDEARDPDAPGEIEDRTF